MISIVVTPVALRGWSGAACGRRVLLRVQLDDQLFLDGLVDVLAQWWVQDGHAEAAVAGLQPGRGLTLQGVHVAADREILAGTALEGDGVALADPVARNVHPLAVDQHVPVADELARLAAAGSPSGPEDHVVEAQLEVAQQVLAGDAGLAARLLVEVAELLLQEPVDPPGLLLLAQLGQVLRALPHAVTAVLTGRVGAAVPVGHRLGDGALERVAALALQEQLRPLAPAETADGSGVSGHDSSSRPDAA